MSKKINLGDSIYNICKQYPELIDKIVELGFIHIKDPNVLNTTGRIMTLPKGAIARKLDLEHIKQSLIDEGYEVVDNE